MFHVNHLYTRIACKEFSLFLVLISSLEGGKAVMKYSKVKSACTRVEHSNPGKPAKTLKK